MDEPTEKTTSAKQADLPEEFHTIQEFIAAYFPDDVKTIPEDEQPYRFGMQLAQEGFRSVAVSD